jgi:amidase
MVLHHSWVGTPAWQIARAVRRGETSASAVVADHLGHIRSADRGGRALRVLRAAEALAEAEAVDDQGTLGMLPLAGVPVLVTDQTPVAGLPRPGEPDGQVADRDHEIVRRLRGAGALIIGVAGAGSDEEPPNADRGCAVAVAAGVAPLALAPDRRGGLRRSAAACGLVGVVPEVNDTAHPPCGVVATTVADAALGLAVASGRDPGPLPGPGRLRVVVAGPVLNTRWPDRTSAETLRIVARALVDLGHDTVVARPPALTRYTVAPRPGDARKRFAQWLTEGGWDVLVRTGTSMSHPPSPPGLATVTIPVGVRADGRPNAIQLIAGPQSQVPALSLAAQLELLAPWRHTSGWQQDELEVGVAPQRATSPG